MRDEAYKALLEHAKGDSSPIQVRAALMLFVIMLGKVNTKKNSCSCIGFSLVLFYFVGMSYSLHE